MTREVVSVHPETSVFEAHDLIAKHNVDGVPVVDAENKLAEIPAILSTMRYYRALKYKDEVLRVVKKYNAAVEKYSAQGTPVLVMDENKLWRR